MAFGLYLVLLFICEILSKCLYLVCFSFFVCRIGFLLACILQVIGGLYKIKYKMRGVVEEFGRQSYDRCYVIFCIKKGVNYRSGYFFF